MVAEVPTYGTSGRFGPPEKNSINFSLSLHCNGSNSFLFLNGKEIFSFKAHNNVNKMLLFLFNSVLEAYLMDLVLLNLESTKELLSGNVKFFSQLQLF